MLNKEKIMGGILLVSGTAIGAGMLALPVSTAANGFFPTSIAFLVCWFFMVLSALLLLEVNLRFPGEKDLLSMIGSTLGRVAQLAALIIYLLLLYALLAAYLQGISAWLMTILQGYYPSLSPLSALMMLGIGFGAVIFCGTRVIDYINRYLVFGLIIAYCVLVTYTLPQVDHAKLMVGSMQGLSGSFSLITTAFGFSIVLPSLINYLHRDAKALRYTVIIGSMIPLMIYLLWEWITLGTIPLTGPYGFAALLSQQDNGTGVAFALEQIVGNAWITYSSRWFSMFAIVTSLLGVSLALFHFLADAVGIEAKGVLRRLLLLVFTYVPPVLMITLYPTGFVQILSVAGIFVSILLGIVPAIMAWCTRRNRTAGKAPYQVWGGNGVLIMVILFFSYIASVEIANCL